MSYGDLIEKMADAGAPMEAILVAVRAMEARDQADQERRAGQAERTRRSRAAKRDGNVTVTVQSQDTPAPLCPPDKEAPEPQEITPPISPRPEEPRPRFADPVLVLQSMVDPLTARNFADHCAQRKPRLTAQSAEGVVRVLRDVAAAGGNPVTALRLAMDRGWAAGFDLDWLRNAGMKLEAGSGKAIDWAGRVKAFHDDGVWPHSWGPKPGEPGCGAPADLLGRAAA